MDFELKTLGLAGAAAEKCDVLLVLVTEDFKPGKDALSRLVAIPRPLWLLDEPTAALDEQGAAWVNRMIAQHLEGGGLAVIATHLPLGLSGAVETLALAPRRAA